MFSDFKEKQFNEVFGGDIYEFDPWYGPRRIYRVDWNIISHRSLYWVWTILSIYQEIR
jgi:hypothetical protein